MIKLRNYQKEALICSLNHLYSKKMGGCVAMPPGSGKSLVIASIIKEVINRYPDLRILVCTHIKELITQNLIELELLLKNSQISIPTGVYSAGLLRREVSQQVIFAGVASVFSRWEEIGRFHVLIIDECHLVSSKQNSMYTKLIKGLLSLNRNLKIIGFSATPYRLGQGLITDGDIFDSIIYDNTRLGEFTDLIKNGYLCKLIPSVTQTQLNTDHVKIINGRYNQRQLDNAVNRMILNEKVSKEIINRAKDRKKWMIFCANIDHSENINAILTHLGINSCCVHSKLSTKDRNCLIKGYKNGEYTAVVHNGLLSTGNNFPAIDLLAFLAPSVSPSYWIQCLGRGTRIAEGKKDCLVLDFVNNTSRLGPINDPVLPRKKGSTPGTVPIRICEKCGIYNHATNKCCEYCGHEFPSYINCRDTPSNLELVIEEKVYENIDFDVTEVMYYKHVKNGKRPTLRVSYFSNVKRFDEFVNIENPSSNYYNLKWWEQHSQSDMKLPKTVDEILKISHELRIPSRITVEMSEPYPRVKQCHF